MRNDVRCGERAPSTKILRGFGGAGVVEIVEDHDGDTYRCVYAVRLQHAIYVLHAFKKKSKRGAETPKHDMDLIWSRLREAEEQDRATNNLS